MSVAVKDDNIIGGLDDLDIKWRGLFNLKEYSVGFKYALKSLLNRELPESFFAKRIIDDVAYGKALLQAEYDVKKESASLYCNWVSNKFGVTLTALLDSKDKLTEFACRKVQSAFLGADETAIGADYVKEDDKVSFYARYARGDTAAEYRVDSKDLDSIVTISQNIDDENVFSPSLSLKTGDMSFGWLKKWSGGSLQSVLKVGEKLSLTLKEDAKSGAWVVKADIPVEGSEKKTKIGIVREITY